MRSYLFKNQFCSKGVSVVAQRSFPTLQGVPVQFCSFSSVHAKKQLHTKPITLSRERAALPITKICFIRNRTFLVSSWWTWGMPSNGAMTSMPGAQIKQPEHPATSSSANQHFPRGLSDKRQWCWWLKITSENEVLHNGSVGCCVVEKRKFGSLGDVLDTFKVVQCSVYALLLSTLVCAGPGWGWDISQHISARPSRHLGEAQGSRHTPKGFLSLIFGWRKQGNEKEAIIWLWIN